MMGWKWFFRIPLTVFWAITLSLSLTPYSGFLTWLINTHNTTTYFLIFISLYFLIYPIFKPVFPKIKTNGGETMERSTWIIAIIVIALIALIIVMWWAPDATAAAADNIILSPLAGIAAAIVGFLNGFGGAMMLGVGIASGLVLALVIKMVDVPKRIREARGTPKKTSRTMQEEPEPQPAQPIQPKQKVVVKTAASPETKLVEVPVDAEVVTEETT